MRIGKYTFHCLFKEQAFLPEYKGSTFRGVLGHALKTIVCALKLEKCDDCPLLRSCLYVNLFDPSYKAKGVPPPPPYVIEPEDGEGTRFKEGDKLSFNLILFGAANDYLSHFIYAFMEIGEKGIGKRSGDARGRFSLWKVKSGETTVFDYSDQKINDWPTPQDYKPEFNQIHEAGRVKVELLTPLRVKYANHLAADLPFHLLIRAALRRISILYKTYGEGEPPIDYRGIIMRASQVKEVEKDLRWFDWRRYSKRQGQEMMMGGMIGNITYEGNLGEFVPYLRFCELAHIGKQTTFGLGKIRVEIEDQ